MISFMHYGNSQMASYRYRAEIPAKEIGAEINNPRADVHIYSKPIPVDVKHASKAKSEGKTVIVDICDLHFDQQHYRGILSYADLVTCATEWTANFIKEDFGVETFVVTDPYEFEEKPPHCYGSRLLWFGNSNNYDSLERVRSQIEGYPLTVVSNVVGSTPWSIENLQEALSEADIVIIPETAPYKSANRAVEAIRSGCFVVAEPHPSLENLEGIWRGNLKKGIEWASKNPNLANDQTLMAQNSIRSRLSPQTLGSAWKTAIQKAQSNCISAQEKSTGTDG